MSPRQWFADRRALIADINRQRDLLAEKDDQIRLAGEAVAAQRKHVEAARNLATLRQDQLNQARARTRDLSGQLADVREALRALREDIRRREVSSGIAIYPPFTRRQAEGIADHVADKRREDV